MLAPSFRLVFAEERRAVEIGALDAMIAKLKREGDTRERPERRAEAFVELCRQSADH